jgi:hypothetical protein
MKKVFLIILICISVLIVADITLDRINTRKLAGELNIQDKGYAIDSTQELTVSDYPDQEWKFVSTCDKPRFIPTKTQNEYENFLNNLPSCILKQAACDAQCLCSSTTAIGETCTDAICGSSCAGTCTPQCLCASTTAVGNTCTDAVCGSQCAGTCSPQCTCAPYTPIGETCTDSICGSSCDGTCTSDASTTIGSNIMFLRTDIGLSNTGYPTCAYPITTLRTAMEEVMNKIGITADKVQPSWTDAIPESELGRLRQNTDFCRFIGCTKSILISISNGAVWRNYATDENLDEVVAHSYAGYGVVEAMKAPNSHWINANPTAQELIDNYNTYLTEIETRYTESYNMVNSMTCCGSYGGEDTGCAGECPCGDDNACGTISCSEYSTFETDDYSDHCYPVQDVTTNRCINMGRCTEPNAQWTCSSQPKKEGASPVLTCPKTEGNPCIRTYCGTSPRCSVDPNGDTCGAYELNGDYFSKKCGYGQCYMPTYYWEFKEYGACSGEFKSLWQECKVRYGNYVEGRAEAHNCDQSDTSWDYGYRYDRRKTVGCVSGSLPRAPTAAELPTCWGTTKPTVKAGSFTKDGATYDLYVAHSYSGDNHWCVVVWDPWNYQVECQSVCKYGNMRECWINTCQVKCGYHPGEVDEYCNKYTHDQNLMGPYSAIWDTQKGTVTWSNWWRHSETTYPKMTPSFLELRCSDAVKAVYGAGISCGGN